MPNPFPARKNKIKTKWKNNWSWLDVRNDDELCDALFWKADRRLRLWQCPSATPVGRMIRKLRENPMLHETKYFLFITWLFFALPVQIKNVRQREKEKEKHKCTGAKYNGIEPTAHVNEINPQEKWNRATTPTFPRTPPPTHLPKSLPSQTTHFSPKKKRTTPTPFAKLDVDYKQGNRKKKDFM